MAHFAKLDENNNVVNVIVVHNNELLDENGNESEAKGIAFCQSHFGGTWLQTSYNGKIRKNYAGLRYTYDPVKDAFIPPQPFPSWSLNPDTCRWQAPVPQPEKNTDTFYYVWKEETQSWEKIELAQGT